MGRSTGHRLTQDTGKIRSTEFFDISEGLGAQTLPNASSQTDLTLPNTELGCLYQLLFSFDTYRFLADSARDGSDDEGETDVNGGGGAFRGGNRGFGGRGDFGGRGGYIHGCCILPSVQCSTLIG